MDLIREDSSRLAASVMLANGLAMSGSSPVAKEGDDLRDEVAHPLLADGGGGLRTGPH